MAVATRSSVFKRLGKENICNNQLKMIVCKYWLQGRCNRNPCRFLHPNNRSKYSWKNTTTTTDDWKKSAAESIKPINQKRKTNIPNINNPIIDKKQKIIEDYSEDVVINKKQKMIEDYSEDVISVKSRDNIDKKQSQDFCSWFNGKGLSLVAKFEAHTKGIKGIALPSGSDKLYSGSKDKSIRMLDYNNGKMQCGGVVDLGVECETLVNEDSWIFSGLTDGNIKGWNLKTHSEVTLKGSGGKVNAITTYNDLLFAAIQDGTILVWKSNSETTFSQVPVALKGHSDDVLSLVIGAHKLFSGSADHTIRVWDPISLECTHVLNGHTQDVTTVLCWDNYLLSGSLDKKIKVWAATENGSIEEIYQHNVDEEMLQFRGILDAEDKPILVCSCKDSSVRLYDLPSFVERGIIISREQVETIHTSPGGQLFVGDARGLLSFWKLT